MGIKPHTLGSARCTKMTKRTEECAQLLREGWVISAPPMVVGGINHGGFGDPFLTLTSPTGEEQRVARNVINEMVRTGVLKRSKSRPAKYTLR